MSLAVDQAVELTLWPHRLPGHPAAFAGRGTSGQLAALFEVLGTRRCLIVRGDTSYDRCGIATAVDQALVGRDAHFVRAAPWQVTLTDLSAALRTMAEFEPDTVLAIGGGSALDLAKAMTNLAPAGPAELAVAVANGAVIEREIRLVLVPTTAGSGSELTRFATLWDGTRKLSLDAPGLRADVALVDPDLVGSAPGPVLVSAATDALCQAIESSWALASTPESREWSEQALRTMLPAIAIGIAQRSLRDPRLHEPLMLGAALAGAAINTSRTTAAHALSYPVTAHLGIPHGAAVGVFVPWLLEHNRSVADVQRLQHISGELAGEPLTSLIPRLLGLADYPVRPDQLALTDDARRELFDMTESTRMQNNPRAVTRTDLIELLHPAS